MVEYGRCKQISSKKMSWNYSHSSGFDLFISNVNSASNPNFVSMLVYQDSTSRQTSRLGSDKLSNFGLMLGSV